MCLRNAFYHWPRVSIQNDDVARTYYATLRARGHTHGRALRSVADRWLRILMAMLRSRTLYDPNFKRPMLPYKPNIERRVFAAATSMTSGRGSPSPPSLDEQQRARGTAFAQSGRVWPCAMRCGGRRAK